VAVSLLTKEHPIMNSGYAWLVPEANLHCDSDQSGGDVDSMYRFDELVAAGIVKSLRERGFRWSLRATGNVVIDVLDLEGMLDEANRIVYARELVLRAHEIARQIVPARAWNA